MSNTDNKLQKFENAILSKIDLKVKEIENEIQKTKEIEIEKIEEEQSEKSKYIIESTILKIKEKAKKEISIAQITSKKDIIKYRKEIIEKIFNKVKILLLDFCKTEDYKNFIINKIKNIITKNKYNEYIVYLSKNDIKYKDFILKNLNSTIKIIEDTSINIGGFKIEIPKENIMIDELLETNIENKYNEFNKNFKLSID